MTTEEAQMDWYEEEAKRLMHECADTAIAAEELFKKGLDDDGNKLMSRLDELHVKALEFRARLVRDRVKWSAVA